MENATEALKMAAAVLVFVLALSITISAFGEARQSAQIVLEYKDRDYDNDTYLNYNVKTTKRIVGAETIIPSIYKAYKENYKIVFKQANGTGMELYKKAKTTANSTDPISICSIDLQKDVLGSDEEKENFIKALLYGSKNTQIIEDFAKRGIILQKESFYDKIKEKTFEESLGVYYQEELEGQSNAPDAKLTQKRVITYTAQS